MSVVADNGNGKTIGRVFANQESLSHTAQLSDDVEIRKEELYIVSYDTNDTNALKEEERKERREKERLHSIPDPKAEGFLPSVNNLRS